MSVLYNSLSLVLYTALVFTLAGSSAVTQAAPGHGQIARDHFSTELSFDQTLCPFVQRYFFFLCVHVFQFHVPDSIDTSWALTTTFFNFDNSIDVFPLTSLIQNDKQIFFLSFITQLKEKY